MSISTSPAWQTFEKKRRCLHCGQLIPDQAHGSQKFCSRFKLPDGSIRSCKDDFHAARRKIVNAPFKRIAEHHKQMYLQIDALFKGHGENVSQELINRYGINLKRPFELEKKGDLYTFFYQVYAIKQFGDGEYKIYKHGRIF